MARISEDNPLIAPNYPVPFSNNFYEVGQYSPSDSTLSALRLLEAKDQGLFYDPTIDIYDDEGNIDENKVARLNKEELLSFAALVVDNVIPFYALLNLRAVFKQVEIVFNLFKITKVYWHKKSEIRELVDFDPDLAIIGSSFSHDKIYLHVFQPYYLYLTVPVVRRVPNFTQGISVASLATAKEIANITFQKLSASFPEQIEKFISLRGWKREKLSEEDLRAGEFFGLKLNKNLYHDNDEVISLESTLGPKEDFIEAFVFYFFHRNYLQQFPKVFAYMRNLEKFLEEL